MFILTHDYIVVTCWYLLLEGHMRSINNAIDILVALAMKTHGYEYNEALILIHASLQLNEKQILETAKPPGSK